MAGHVNNLLDHFPKLLSENLFTNVVLQLEQFATTLCICTLRKHVGLSLCVYPLRFKQHGSYGTSAS